MSKLWVFGDSFSVVHTDDPSPDQWHVSLAAKLGYELKDCSLWGACQDWVFAYIESVQENISPEDQVIIALPDPARFWFFDDHPSITSVHVLNYDKIINDSSRVKAVEGYIRYIQRPHLDTHFITLRLGYLNNIATVKKWKPPIVILAGEMSLPPVDNFNRLIISEGSLRGIDSIETLPPFVLTGDDVRYNHLSLRNHYVLTDKLLDIITKKENSLNLLEGFHSRFITKDNFTNKEFIDKEFSPWLYNRNKKIYAK